MGPTSVWRKALAGAQPPRTLAWPTLCKDCKHITHLIMLWLIRPAARNNNLPNLVLTENGRALEPWTRSGKAMREHGAVHSMHVVCTYLRGCRVRCAQDLSTGCILPIKFVSLAMIRCRITSPPWDSRWECTRWKGFHWALGDKEKNARIAEKPLVNGGLRSVFGLSNRDFSCGEIYTCWCNINI